MHKLTKDLTVDLGADRPGTLAKAFDTVAKAGINVDGYAGIGGTLHILTQDPGATRRVLETGGFRVSKEDDVVLVDVQDRLGVAARIFGPIAEANVNVTFSYVATNNRIVIGANNVAKIDDILARYTAGVA
jgi:hypothetical protein